MIRPSTKTDIPAILNMIEASGEFDADGVQFVESLLNQHFYVGDSSIWLTAELGDVLGVAYCAAEPMALGVWNLLMLWTRADAHRRGHGTGLVSGVLDRLKQVNARLLLVETSGADAFGPARDFYVKNGFKYEATIRNYYGQGEDKWIFTLPL